MSGWVEPLPSGRFRAVHRDPAGGRHSQTFPTRKEAKAFLSQVQTDQARGQWLDPRAGQVLFAEWAHRWQRARVVRPSTAASEEGRLRNHLLPAFGSTQLQHITPLAVRSLVAELAQKRSAKTVRNVHALLSTILRDAVLEGLLLSNPCTPLRMTAGQPFEARFLSPDELDLLVKATPADYQALVLTAAGTGLRWGELAGLPIKRLDLLRRRLEVVQTLTDVNGQLSIGPPKTSSSRRTVSLPPTVVETLSRHLVDARSELVFTCRDGSPLRRSNFYSRVWRPAVTAAALDPAPRFHDLRHSHVAMLISAGVPMKAIQHRLGHSSILMTMDRYGHLLPEVDRDLVDALERQLNRPAQ